MAAPVPPNKNRPRLIDVRHPFFTASVRNWRKWRLCYEGGDRFIEAYLRRFSKREDDQDFLDRKYVTYNPAFAKKAVNEVKNAVFQRMVDVARVGGDPTYQAAVAGQGRGVDLLGASMNAFIGRRLLPELLVMGRVGCYVDMPVLESTSKAAVKGKQPYLYWYPAEDVCSWTTNDDDEFTELLLIDSVIEANGDEYYLPYDTIRRYRHVWLDDEGYVCVQVYGEDDLGAPNSQAQEPVALEPVRLNIRKIPFVLLEISDSLLMDAANYQIALLNLASGDMGYALKANFPFYVEQFDPRVQSPHLKQAGENQRITQSTNQAINSATQYQIIVTNDKVHEVKVGPASGRRYPTGTNQPAFIHPRPEPLHASMAKQDQLKQEIRELVLGAVSQLSPKPGTPANTSQADTGLEAGLAYIGLELQHAERMIAAFWAMYMGGAPATVTYPESYELKTDEDRRKEAADLEALMAKLPSRTYQKAIARRMARVLLGPKISAEDLAMIDREIDDAVVVTTDPAIVKTDFDAGFVGLETASKIRGYPEGEVEKAKKDHAERVARIAIAQSEGAGAPAKSGGGLANPQSRGLTDLSANADGGRQEKALSRDTTTDESTASKVRGAGKKTPAGVE
jgi:hypothetical protein